MRPIILCGGVGTRLWPKSRESFPKQFMPIFDNKSLLDLTVERILNIKFLKKPIFLCNKNHGFLVKKSLEKYNLEAEIFLEPISKNTCSAIYIAAKHCNEKERLLIMPADHLIPNNSSFAKDIEIIKNNFVENHWFTLGIKPTKPSDAYGYILAENNNVKLNTVLNFVEKPSKKIASELINNSNCYWNAGIFIASARTIINSVNNHAPEIATMCNKVFEKIFFNKLTNEYNFPDELFSKIPSKSIDYAVMEKEKNIYLYPFEDKWSDVGSWDSISEIRNFNKTNKNIIQIESKNNFIINDKRTIATIGLEEFIIIDSDDAILITKKNQSEKVKLVVDQLLKKNLSVGIEHSFEFRPWGKFENLLIDTFCKVKKIIIYPQKKLSLQYHNFRSEHWLIVSGVANVYLDGKNFILLPGQSIDIPKKSHHYIENTKNKNLVIIETQLGSYFGEDDIVRLEDPYFR
jgi:mannose-1-phosphate guanylyltransferase/mannose-6-phosphate isomerase